MRKNLAQLGCLGADDKLAVRLLRIIREIILVIVFRRPESRRWQYGGDDGVRPDMGGAQLGDQRLRDGGLFRIVREDDRAVLCAHIVALAIERGRVVDGEKRVEQGAVVDDRRIEMHLYDFRMPGGAVADAGVIRLVLMPAGIAGNGRVDTG